MKTTEEVTKEVINHMKELGEIAYNNPNNRTDVVSACLSLIKGIFIFFDDKEKEHLMQFIIKVLNGDSVEESLTSIIGNPRKIH